MKTNFQHVFVALLLFAAGCENNADLGTDPASTDKPAKQTPINSKAQTTISSADYLSASATKVRDLDARNWADLSVCATHANAALFYSASMKVVSELPDKEILKLEKLTREWERMTYAYGASAGFSNEKLKGMLNKDKAESLELLKNGELETRKRHGFKAGVTATYQPLMQAVNRCVQKIELIDN